MEKVRETQKVHGGSLRNGSVWETKGTGHPGLEWKSIPDASHDDPPCIAGTHTIHPMSEYPTIHRARPFYRSTGIKKAAVTVCRTPLSSNTVRYLTEDGPPRLVPVPDVSGSVTLSVTGRVGLVSGRGRRATGSDRGVGV